MLNATHLAKASTVRLVARRVAVIAGWARRAERSLWSALVAVLWPAAFALAAAISGMLAWAGLSPTASLDANLLYSLLMVLFVLVMATVLLGADAELQR